MWRLTSIQVLVINKKFIFIYQKHDKNGSPIPNKIYTHIVFKYNSTAEFSKIYFNNEIIYDIYYLNKKYP